MGKKILVVDDEKDVLKLLTHRLESSGYEVITSGDGKDGLDKAREKKLDLIILDLMLPTMNGYEVCRFLKFDRQYSKLPIILFTARSEDTDRGLSQEVGANAYITKPFDYPVLLAKIKELLKE